jgi:predicted metal-dependent hydrolase
MALALTSRLACSFPAGESVGMDEASRKQTLRLKAEVRRWAKTLDLQPSAITVRAMNTKWGSCSIGGRLTFDSNLALQPKEVRDEVIVHELLHLRVPNHGPLFRSLLRAHMRNA